MKNLIIILALVIGGSVIGQNANTTINKNELSKSKKNINSEEFNKNKISTDNSKGIQKKEAVQISSDIKSVSLGEKGNVKKVKVKDDPITYPQDEMNDVDQEYPNSMKEKPVKEKEGANEASIDKGNNGNAFGKNKEGLSKAEFVEMRSNKNKDRKVKKEKKPKKVKKDKKVK